MFHHDVLPPGEGELEAFALSVVAPDDRLPPAVALDGLEQADQVTFPLHFFAILVQHGDDFHVVV